MIREQLPVDTRRLQLLLSLSRLGSMRAVADAHHLTTSTVSQQIAALAKETGAQLIEPEGRRVRLTPAGQRLADHAVTILAAVDSARLDLDPDAEPAGTVRVGGFATGIRVSLLPIVADLAEQYPDVRFVISEYEPIEAFALLTDDDLDLALTYDYNLAPASPEPVLQTVALWSITWGLASRRVLPTDPPTSPPMPIETWIVNSRNTADEDAVRTLASLAGFAPAHRARDRQPRPRRGSDRRRLRRRPAAYRPADQQGRQGAPAGEPEAMLTAYAVTRRGRATWPPLRAVLDRMRPAPGPSCPARNGRVQSPGRKCLRPW